MSESLLPHGLQHARLLCSSLSPGVCSNSYPLSWWWYIIISSSAALFSFCLHSIPASGSFPMSRLLASGGQSIGASAWVLPMDAQGWFPLRLTGLISLQAKGLSRVQYHYSKALGLCSAFFMAQFSHLFMTTGKTTALTIQIYVEKWCSCFLIYCLGLL